MKKTKTIAETDISHGIRSAFNLPWPGIKPKTAGPHDIYASLSLVAEAKASFDADIPAQENLMWTQRDREEREVQAAHDQVLREDVEFVETWDARI